MRRAGPAQVLLLALLTAAPLAGSRALARDTTTPMYVETFVPAGTQLNVLKRVNCAAPGQPELSARIYMVRVGRRLKVARVDYTPALRSVLLAKKLPVLNRYYDQYMTRGEVFDEWTMNTLISLSRVLGMKFDLDGHQYRCTLS